MTRARDLASGINGVRPFAMAAGTVTSTSTGDVTVTFPSGRFTQTPLMQATAIGAESVIRITSLSTTGFSTNFYANFYGTAQVRYAGIGINYLAVQMTSGAASG